jgi:hypothetical protein
MMKRKSNTFLSYLLTEMDDRYADGEDRTEQNPTDTVTVDVPLLIRLMEYAKEDAADDMALHQVAERLTQLSAEGKTLTMDDYDAIVGGDQPEQQDPRDQMMAADQEDEETTRKASTINKLKKDYADKMRWSREEAAKTGRDRSGHAMGASKIRAHLKNMYGVEM